MANTYVVTQMVSVGGVVAVSGTVNGSPVQVGYPASQTFANVLLFEAFIQPLMLAAFNALPVPLVGFTGTWTA
jgi:hypothetical protein